MEFEEEDEFGGEVQSSEVVRSLFLLTRIALLIASPVFCGLIAGDVIHIAAVASSPVLQALLPIMTGALMGLLLVDFKGIMQRDSLGRRARCDALDLIMSLVLLGFFVSILLGFAAHLPNIIDLILTQAIPPAFVVGFFAAGILSSVCLFAMELLCISPTDFWKAPPFFALITQFFITTLPAVALLMAFSVIPVTTIPAVQVGLFVLSFVLSAVLSKVLAAMTQASKLSVKQLLGSLSTGILVGFLGALAFGYGSTFPNIIHLIASHAIPVPVTVAVSVSWVLLALVCITYDRLVSNKGRSARGGEAVAFSGTPYERRPAPGLQPQSQWGRVGKRAGAHSWPGHEGGYPGGGSYASNSR